MTYNHHIYQYYLKTIAGWDSEAPYWYSEYYDLQYLYMRSFKGLDTAWLSKDYVQNLFSYAATMNTNKQQCYSHQAKLSLVLYRMGRESEAKAIIESLRKKAVRNQEMGMYWPCDCESNKWGYGSQTAVAQQALMIEAFTEISPRQEELNAMRQWLLLQRKGNDWGNIKDAVEAIYALMLNDGEQQVEPSSASMKVGNELFTDPGTGYMKHVWTAEEMSPKLADIELHTDSIHPIYGACYWQYMEDVDKVESAGDELHVMRTLLHQPKNSGDKYEPVTAENPVRVGERITVHIAIHSKQDLAFVYMKDPYIAAFVPADIHERLGWGTDVHWVESPRHASISFFFHRLPMGTTVVEYELIATHSGTYILGPATIECEYAPEYRAQRGGGKIEIVGQ